MNRLKITILSILTTFSLGVVAFNQTQNIISVKAYANNDAATYYSGVGQYDKGTTLLTYLQSLNAAKKRSSINYNSMMNYFKQTDPGDYSGQVRTFYSGKSASTSQCNREHVWPNSHGGNAVENDIHMVRPTLKAENEGRGNSFYVEGMNHEYDGWDPANCGDETYRGDAARIVFYCVVAYSGFELLDVNKHYTTSENNDYKMGKLSDLLKWNLQYPVTNRENVRNEAAESLQGNRNPFIDHPEYACRIWGNTNGNTQNVCRAYGTLGKLDIKDNNVAATSFRVETDEVLNLSASVGNSTSGAFTFAICTADGTITTSDKISISSSNNNVAITGLSKGKAYLKVSATETLPNGTTDYLWDIIEINVFDKVIATGLYIDSFPIKTDYYVGDTFNPYGLKVMVTYSDNSFEDVTNYITFGDTTLSQSGVKNIEVFYTFKGETLRTSFSVIVRENSAPPSNSSGGCGGNISSTSFLLSSFALIGVFSLVLTLKKRKK